MPFVASPVLPFGSFWTSPDLETSVADVERPSVPLAGSGGADVLLDAVRSGDALCAPAPWESCRDMLLVTSSCEGVGSDSLPDDRIRVLLGVAAQVVVRHVLGRWTAVLRSLVCERDVPDLEAFCPGCSLLVYA